MLGYSSSGGFGAMADKAIKFKYDPDKTLRLFPDERHDVSLDTWVANAKVANQREAPNKGLYDAIIDDTYRYWVVFEGSDQPTDWSKWVMVVDIESGKITADDLTPSALQIINQNIGTFTGVI